MTFETWYTKWFNVNRKWLLEAIDPSDYKQLKEGLQSAWNAAMLFNMNVHKVKDFVTSTNDYNE